MKLLSVARRFLAVALAIAALGVVACGPAAKATPTPAPTPTVQPLPPLIIPTPTIITAPTPTIAAQVVVATPTPTATATPAPKKEEPRRGGVIKKAETTVNIFDPHHTSAGYGLQLGMVGNLFSQLIRVSPQDRQTVEGDLAESWAVSADGTQYKFKLRSGLVDHTGKPFTAEDLYWNMVRYVERPNGVAVRRQGCVRLYVKDILEGDQLTGNAVLAAKTLPQPGAEVTGPLELTIRLKGPRAAFIPCLTGGFIMFHPNTYVKKIDTDPSAKYRDLDPNKGELAETGPFKVKKVEIDNFMELERSDKYYRQGLPYLDGMIVYAIPDQAARVAAFRTGRIDTTCTWVCISKSDADALKKELGDGVTIPSLVAIGYRSIQVNTGKPPFGPWDNPNALNLRRAINLRLDRDEINKLAFDGIGFLSPPYHIGWDYIYTEDEWRKFPGWARSKDKAPEIEQAKALMQKEGYGPNNRIKTVILADTSGQGLRAGETVATELADIYIDVEVVKVDFVAKFDRATKAGDFGLYEDSVGAPFNDPDAYHTNIFFLFEEGSRNVTKWMNPKWRELHEKQTVLQTLKERAPILREMAKIAIEDAAMLGTIRPAVQQPYRGNWRGWVPPPLDGSNFSIEYVWLAP
ncbi:MAG: ABC transporter substrate-binding protein [Chloroflexi bacterium]|nr:ABC transporter substrate-binding protein [Chloroflexota bacterium]